MAYNPRSLSVIGYANGFTLWHYATPDPAADTTAAGYFDKAGDMLRVGDFIFANSAAGAAVPQHGILVVAANQNGAVSVAALAAA